MEGERERWDRILEAVAFGGRRMLEPGPWHAHADAVTARLGHAADAARAWLGEITWDPDGSPRVWFRSSWGAPGYKVALDDPRIRDGVPLGRVGLAVYAAE